MSTLIAFVPVAVLLTITPGAATAMVVRNAARGGRRHALACTVGNEAGVIAWALLAAVGVAAIVATSAAIFAVVKLVGAGVLILIGIQSLRGHRAKAQPPPPHQARPARRRPHQPHQPEARGLLRRPLSPVRPRRRAGAPLCAGDGRTARAL